MSKPKRRVKKGECVVCGAPNLHAKDRCQVCYRHLQRTGMDRDEAGLIIGRGSKSATNAAPPARKEPPRNDPGRRPRPTTTKPGRDKRREKDGSALVHVSATTAAVLYDGARLDDWDDEELLRGMRRRKDGSFRGRRPIVVPFELHRELTRRRMQRAHALLAHSLVDAANMLTAIINDPEVGARTKLQAIELLFNRVLGKPREQVSLDVTSDPELKPWQKAVITGIVGTVDQIRELEAAKGVELEVVEGEVVEEPAPKPSRAGGAG